MTIELINNPDDALREVVNAELRSYNQQSNPVFWKLREQPGNDPIPLNLFAFDEDRTVIGGLFGTTQFSWLKVDIMATRAEYRRSGVGTALLERAESIARERGCRHAYVDTMDYQAPEFYIGAGYEVVGRLDDWDSHGHAKIFLVKEL